MAKEPWQEDIYENQEETRTQRRKREQGGGVVANRILTILASIFFVIVVVMIIVLIYLSFTVAYALSTLMGLSFAFLTVTGVYILIFLLCIFNRRRWIERPLVRFLADLLIDK